MEWDERENGGAHGLNRRSEEENSLLEQQNFEENQDFMSPQNYQLPQACLDVKVVDVVVGIIYERCAVGAALNPECKTPVKFIVRLFQKFFTIEISLLENLINNDVQFHFDVTEKGEAW